MKKIKKVRESKSRIKVIREIVNRREDEVDSRDDIEFVEEKTNVGRINPSLSPVSSNTEAVEENFNFQNLRRNEDEERRVSGFYESVQGARQREERRAYVNSVEQQQRFVRRASNVDNVIRQRDILQTPESSAMEKAGIAGGETQYYEMQKPGKKEERRDPSRG